MNALANIVCNNTASGTDCGIFYATSTASSTIINSFTAGELVQITFLFIIIVVLVYANFYNWLKGVKIRQ